MEAQKFCLKWDGFQGSVTSVFDHLRQDSELVDITLCCEGKRVRAHRMMLSACSPYFRELFKANPTIPAPAEPPCRVPDVQPPVGPAPIIGFEHRVTVDPTIPPVRQPLRRLPWAIRDQELSGQQLVVFLKDTSAADLTAIVEFMYKGSVNVAQSQLASFIKTAEMLQVQGLSGGDDKDRPPSPAPPPPPEPGRGWSQQQHHQPPASPAASLRRAADAAASPEPRHKRRRAEPPPPAERLASPPPPPPPPPPAPAQVAAAMAVDVPLPEETPQEPAAGQFENAVKVEKFDVDLTLDDEEDGGGGGEDLEAALGHVAQYEGYDPGSDQSLSADGQLFAGGDGGPLSGNAVGPGGAYTPGPSQRTGEDGSQDHGADLRCPVCSACYSHRRSLTEHLKKHSGRTTCPMCGQKFMQRSNMRRHMVLRHGLAKEEVNTLTNTRHWHSGGEFATAAAAADTDADADADADAAAKMERELLL